MTRQRLVAVKSDSWGETVLRGQLTTNVRKLFRFRNSGGGSARGLVVTVESDRGSRQHGEGR